jgi:hypothetical protein
MPTPSSPHSLPQRLAEVIASFDGQHRLLLELWLQGLGLADIVAATGLPETAAAEALRDTIDRTRERLSE